MIEALITGRVGVDLYPEQSGVPLAEVRTFSKSLGGTATNVAVGAARLGRSVGLLTKVGPDPFGTYVREALSGFGVDPQYVGTAADLLTPVVFCALDPPEDPPLLFYRLPTAPDLTLTEAEVPWEVVRDCALLWVTGTGASVQPARATQHRMLSERSARRPPHLSEGRFSVLDLDWRPMFWTSPHEARREYEEMLRHCNVVTGNRAEVAVAVGTSDPPEAASRLLEAGVELALIKQGAQGVLVATRSGQVTVPAQPVEVVCGLGAGDAFGAAVVHGLLSAWDPARIGRYANAAGAIVASRLACADAMPTWPELEAMVSGDTAEMTGTS